MAITVVQSVTGGTGTLVLNGVAAGNTLFVIQSFYRTVSTGAALPVPADTNGTFSASQTPTPGAWGGHDAGIGIFHQYNVLSGTHTVTPNNTTDWKATLCEVAGLLTASALDVTTSAVSSNNDHISQVTGTTATTAQASELVLIGLCVAATSGSNPLGINDPVPSFTTLYKVDNDQTDIGTLHAYQIVNAIGTQAATFNWTGHDTTTTSQAAIATFKATVTETLWAQSLL